MRTTSFKLSWFIGPVSFYKYAFSLAIPLGITNLLAISMGALDTLMISWIHQVSAVGTATQIEVIALNVVWACAAGTGIYAIQFFGAGDYKNLKRCFGLSISCAAFVGILTYGIITLFSASILHFYIQNDEVIWNGCQYLRIAKYAYILMSFQLSFSVIYRNLGKPFYPFVIGMITFLMKMLWNVLLIFGYAGFPKLGIIGAPLASCIAHSIALAVNIILAYKTKQPFVGKIREMFSYDLSFIRRILPRIRPLLLNEILFGFGNTLFVKAFGFLGIEAMNAYYIGAKIGDLFFAVANGFSDSISSIIGISLGQGKLKEAGQQSMYLISMAIGLCLGAVILITCFSPFLVSLFEVQSASVLNNAIWIVRIFALRIGMRFFIVIIFGTLRTGGDTKALMFLDSGLMYMVGLSIAFGSILVFRVQSIVLVFLLCQTEYVLRILFGMMRYRKGLWKTNLVS